MTDEDELGDLHTSTTLPTTSGNQKGPRFCPRCRIVGEYNSMITMTVITGDFIGKAPACTECDYNEAK